MIHSTVFVCPVFYQHCDIYIVLVSLLVYVKHMPYCHIDILILDNDKTDKGRITIIFHIKYFYFTPQENSGEKYLHL